MSFTIPESITSIGCGAFAGCSSLTSIIIPNSITALGGETFSGCTNLVDIKLPDNLTTIQVYDFYSCVALQKISIPESVTTIGNYAFYECNTLTSVTVGNPVPVSISENTFSNADNSILFIPVGSKAIYGAADYWKDFKEIVEIETEVVLGDANGDGTVDANDIVDIVNHTMGNPTSTGKFNKKAADINEDGVVNIADIVAISNIIMKK